MRNMRSILTSILIISMLVLFTGPATAATQGELTDLLKQHPTVANGGTVEICEMPKS